MRYWNADGLPAALCINGTRCAARLALHLGWAKASFPVTTDAGTFAARAVAPTEIALQLPAPEELPRRRVLEVGGKSHEGWFVTVGVPHLVLVWPESLAAGSGRRARRGAARACRSSRPAAPTSTSCASRLPTGWRSAASSAASKPRRSPAAPESSRRPPSVCSSTSRSSRSQASTLGGFTLTVDGQTVDSALRNWSLAGDARILGSVELTPEAGLPAPPAPHWSRLGRHLPLRIFSFAKLSRLMTREIPAGRRTDGGSCVAGRSTWSPRRTWRASSSARARPGNRWR